MRICRSVVVGLSLVFLCGQFARGELMSVTLLANTAASTGLSGVTWTSFGDGTHASKGAFSSGALGGVLSLDVYASLDSGTGAANGLDDGLIKMFGGFYQSFSGVNGFAGSFTAAGTTVQPYYTGSSAQQNPPTKAATGNIFGTSSSSTTSGWWGIASTQGLGGSGGLVLGGGLGIKVGTITYTLGSYGSSTTTNTQLYFYPANGTNQANAAGTNIPTKTFVASSGTSTVIASGVANWYVDGGTLANSTPGFPNYVTTGVGGSRNFTKTDLGASGTTVHFTSNPFEIDPNNAATYLTPSLGISNLRAMLNGSSKPATLTISNSGTTPGTFSLISGAGDGLSFGLAGTTTLAAGAGTTSTVGWGSTSLTGSRSGFVTLSSLVVGDSGAPHSVAATGAVVDNRLVAASTANLGRAMVNFSGSGTTTLSTSGDNNHFTRVSVAGSLFNSATSTATATISSSFSTTGTQSASLVLTTSGEGLTGESPINVTVPFTATVLDNRTVTASAASFGRAMVNFSGSGTTTLSTSGDNNHFTRVTVAGSLFNSATSTATPTVSGSFGTTGMQSSSLILTTSGEGLVGESPINVTVPYSATVLANRVVASTAVNLGRFMVGFMNSGNTILSSTGDDDHFTRVNVAGTLFNTGNIYATPTISSSFSTTGTQSTSQTLTATGEGLVGESPINVVVPVSATSVANRSVTATTANFGRVMLNVAGSGTTTLSTSGDDNHFTRVTVGGSLFNSATSTATASVSGSFGTTGTQSSTIALPTSAEGLAYESPINVGVPVSATVLDNRVVGATSIGLARIMLNVSQSGTTTLSTSGDDNHFTRVTAAGTLFNSATSSAATSVSTSFGTAGLQNKTTSLTATGEGLAGESPINVPVNWSATVLDNRVVAGSVVNFGYLHLNATATGSSTLATSGDNIHATSLIVALSGGTGNVAAINDGYALGTSFSTASAVGLRKLQATFLTSGSIGGNIQLAVTGEGLAGEADLPASIPYTAVVYTGSGNWIGGGGNRSWGTSANWLDASSVAGVPSPGISGYATDAATLGSVSSGTVNLDGANPSLASLTINSSTGSYTLAQGSGGTLAITGSSGDSIFVQSGTHSITAPVSLSGSNKIDAAGSSRLTIAGALGLSGSGLTKSGYGTLVLGANNSYSGGTNISAGTLQLGNGGNTGSIVGSITNNGALAFGRSDNYTFNSTVSGTGSLVQVGPGTLTLSGTWANPVVATAGRIVVAAGSSLTGDLTLAAGSRVENNSNSLQIANFNNAGTFIGSADPTGTFANQPTGDIRILAAQHIFAQSAGSQSNAGLLEVLGTLLAPAQFEAAGPFTNVSNGKSLIAVHNAQLYFDGGLTNQGPIAVTYGGADVFGTVNNAATGNINVAGGGVISFYGDVTQNGTFKVSTVGATHSSAVFFGALSGSGGFTGGGDVFVQGSLRPGASPSPVVYDGNVTLQSGATTQINLAGPTIASQYSAGNVTGVLALAGTLNVSLTNPSFHPAHLSQFQVLQFGTKSGDFAAYTGLNLGNRVQLVPSYVGNSLILTAILGGSGGWNVDASGVSSVGGNWSGGLPNGIGDAATFGSAITAPRTVTVDRPTTYGSIVLDNTAGYTLSGSGTLTLQTTAANSQIDVLHGSHTIAAALDLESNTAVNDAAGNLQITGRVLGIGSLSKTGSGTLILSGSGSFTGGTTINNGTLYLAATGALLDGSSLTVAGGGTLIFDPSPPSAAVAAGLTAGPSAVPEPGTLALLAAAAVAISLRRRTR